MNVECGTVSDSWSIDLAITGRLSTTSQEHAVHTHSHDGRPTDDELVAVVEQRDSGMSALDLLQHFRDEGYSDRDIQRAIQRALNANKLELGSKLRLYARSKVAA